MARTNPITFFQQVRVEVGKVTWPSRAETLISTIMVLAFCAMAAIFFVLADQIIAWVVTTVLAL